MNEVKFQRTIDNVLAQADDNGLWIFCGWSVPVQRKTAVSYVKTYNGSPDIGFFENDGKVILTHNHGKITFSQQEAAAVIDLIKAAYPEAA